MQTITIRKYLSGFCGCGEGFKVAIVETQQKALFWQRLSGWWSFKVDYIAFFQASGVLGLTLPRFQISPN
jgi:hypothetical protein